MKDSMDRSWPGQEKSNDLQNSDSENESSDNEGGAELSIRSLRSPKPNTQSASTTTSNASGHGQAGHKRDTVSYSLVSSALKPFHTDVSF